MATQEEIEQKRQERKRLLDEVKSRRAAAAQAEGVVGAAEEGQYGDVGQGGPKGEFDDEIDQDPGNEDPSRFSMENVKRAILGEGGGLEALMYFLPGTGDVMSAQDSIRAAKAAQEAEDIVDKIKLYGLSGLAAAGAVPFVSAIYDAGGPAVKRMINDAIKQSQNMTPQLALPGGGGVMNIDDVINMNLRVGETTGTGPSKSGIGGEVAGVTNNPPRQMKVLADSEPDLSKLIVKGDDGKDYVLIGSNKNNRLVELDKVKLVKKRLNEPDRNPRDQYYFELKSKADDKRMTVDEPGTFVKVGRRKLPVEDTTRIYPDEPMKNRASFYRLINEDAKLIKEKNDADAKFVRYFRDNLTDEKNFGKIAKQSDYRFFNNIRRTEPDLFDDPSAFFKQYKTERIQPGGDLHEKYLRFTQIDEIRKTDIENLKPILQKILGKDARVHFEVAHKYIASGIKKGFVDKSKTGTGADPAELYIDLAEYNSKLQGGLESQARKIITEGLADGKTLNEIKNMRDFKLLDLDMKNLGLQGEAYGLKIGDAKPIDEKIGDLIIRGLNTGRISDAESKIAEEAVDRILDAKREYTKMFKEPALMARGGLATMEYMTRPINAQR